MADADTSTDSRMEAGAIKKKKTGVEASHRPEPSMCPRHKTKHSTFSNVGLSHQAAMTALRILIPWVSEAKLSTRESKLGGGPAAKERHLKLGELY